MPLAQVVQLAEVIPFDRRQAIGRRRPASTPATGVVLQLFRAQVRCSAAPPMIAPDADRIAGRGRDPG
jgi:hypothetical protein